VLGIYLSDLVVAVGVIVLLLPRFVGMIRPVFSMQVLRECLRFGLPRLPHGAAHQIIAGADRYILSLFYALRDVGIYSVGANLGLGMKLFLSAFENAWAPFYFSEMKQPDAKRTFRTVTTYGMTVLLLMVAGLSAVAYDLVRLMTKPEFYGAARFVPWIALSVALQGVYLLTSIGLNITKRTVFYPISTVLAAAASVAASLILIPRFGVEAAAWSNTIAYGVLAGTAMWFSQRVYPISYDWGRLARVAVAALVSVLAAKMILPQTVMPIVGVIVRGSTVVALFAAVLALLGFFQPHEIERLKSLGRRLWSKSSAGTPIPE
jgi:O-antigen/teichoic acid export membrane protein